MEDTFTDRVIEFIKGIPPGQVISYGDIAAICGNPRAARQVSRILHCCSEKYNLPWHRVINSKQKISLKGTAGEFQRVRLEAEGIRFSSDGKCLPSESD